MQIQYAQSTSGSGFSPTASYTDFLTVPITVVGSSATVRLDAVIGGTKSGTGNISARLLWDGVQIAETVVSVPSGYETVLCVSGFVAGVAAASHTATLQVAQNTYGTTVGGTGRASSLAVTEY